MDYGKYRYQEEQKAKQARKHQSQVHVKEIKLRPKIAVQDYETKKGHVVRFLNQRAKVKVTIMFRGRETTHPERGRDLLMRLAEDVKELGVVESPPLLDGRNMVMVLGPRRTQEFPKMPKQKTSRQRRRVQGDRAGKILRRKGPQAHKLEKKSAKLKRSFRRPAALSGSDYRAVIRLLGGKRGGR